MAAGVMLTNTSAANAVPSMTPTKYANCKALNAKYPGGVAKSASARNMKTVNGRLVPAASKYRPKVSASLYKTYKSMDRDRDGIACER